MMTNTIVLSLGAIFFQSGLEVYNNSTEPEIYPAHKC